MMEPLLFPQVISDKAVMIIILCRSDYRKRMVIPAAIPKTLMATSFQTLLRWLTKR